MHAHATSPMIAFLRETLLTDSQLGWRGCCYLKSSLDMKVPFDRDSYIELPD